MRRYLVPTVVALAVTVTACSGPLPDSAPREGSASAPATAPGAQGVVAPECPLPDISAPNTALTGIKVRCLGSDVETDLGAALADRPTLINLWASWCGPCRSEIPVLDRYAREPGAVRVVGLNVLDRPGAAWALWHELDAAYPSFVDLGGALSTLGAPPVLPLTYLLRGDGTVRRVTSPAVFDDTAAIRAAVAENL